MELKQNASEPPQYKSHSDKMAEIARNYHSKLQQCNIAENQETSMAEVLAEIDTSLKPENAEILGKEILVEEVHKAIMSMPNGKATGINGLPYELWKGLI